MSSVWKNVGIAALSPWSNLYSTRALSAATMSSFKAVVVHLSVSGVLGGEVNVCVCVCVCVEGGGG